MVPVTELQRPSAKTTAAVRKTNSGQKLDETTVHHHPNPPTTTQETVPSKARARNKKRQKMYVHVPQVDLREDKPLLCL
jgi:hypothetical protein